MSFDLTKMEISRTVYYNNIKYQVIEQTSSGILIAAKEEDVKNNHYPLHLVAIPDEYEDL